MVGEAEAALAVAHDQIPLERAELVALEVQQVPVRVRRRGRVAQAARVVVGAYRAVRHPDELLRAHRAGRDRSAAADPHRAVADVVGRGGEAERRAGDAEPERRALVEVGQQLAGADLGRAGVARLLGEGSPGSTVRNVILPSRANEGETCSEAPLTTCRGLPPSGSTVQMSKLPPASGLAA